MTIRPRLFPRGFLLTPTDRTLPPDVISPRVHHLQGYTLHTEDLVEVDIAEKEGAWVAVLGKAWPLSTGAISPDTSSVASDLLKFVTEASWIEQIDEALYDIGGRYAIIIRTDDKLVAYNDACGNRSVFYSAQTQEIASHFSLIRSGLPDRALERPIGNDHREDLSWENTRSKWIQTLVPNHRLSLPEGVQTRYFPVDANRSSPLSSDERLELISSLWEEQLEIMVKSNQPKAISITAGLDSRTLLAMAHRSTDKFIGFTYTSTEAVDGAKPSTYWSRSGQIDYQGVEILRPFLPSNFQYLSIPADRASDPATEWVEEYKNTLNRNAERSHNRRLLPRYLELFDNPRTIHYRGNLLEIGRLHFRTLEGTRESAFNDLISDLAGAADIDVQDALERAHEGAERLGYFSMPREYDLTDIFYWEQRHGRWFAQVLNETDVAFDTVTPFNVRRIIDLFLAYSMEDRANAFAQKELIYRSSPLLTFAGVNGEPDLYRKFVSKGRPQRTTSDQSLASRSDNDSHSNQAPRVTSADVQIPIARQGDVLPVPTTTSWDDHYRAPIFKHTSLASLDFGTATTAIHEVDLGRGKRIDFYAKLEPADALFVSLHGAVPLAAPRYPHFRRVESMKNRVSALLCIADPSLALSDDDDFRLAWYAGSAEWDPIAELADIVRKAQEYVGARRVMFLGGSGGGFASLRIAPQFPGSMAFVQDPQTDVARYYPSHLDRLFGAIWPGWEKKEAFEKYPERFNLLHLYPRLDPNVFIYYRQSNGDQWHIVNHAKPFEEAVSTTQSVLSGNCRFVYEDSEKPGHGKISPAEFDLHFDLAMEFWNRNSR